jgi:hypothetical protein
VGIFPADRPKPAGLLDMVYNTGTGLYRDAGRALGWFARQAAKPDAEVQSDFRNFASDMGTSLASIPEKALGASAEATTSGVYNPAPIVDAAMLPMGGPAAKAGEFVLGAGAKKATPLLGVLHGAGSPDNFSLLTHPPPTHDLGVHTAIAPPITTGYALKHGSDLNAWPYVVKPGEEPKIDFMSKKRFDDPDAAGPRTKPYLLDADGTMKFPIDAGKWNEPWSVITPIEDEMRAGKPYPRGLLEDLHNISGSDEIWQSQFGPMMQDRGINHLFYPHAGSWKPDSFLTFDPNKLTPRYSPEGVKLAEERGVVEPKGHISRKNWQRDPDIPSYQEKPWVMPRGVMYKPQEIETLTREPKKNTFQWWGDDAPPSKVKQLHDEEAALQAKLIADKKAAVDNVAEGKELYKQYTSGKITEDQYHEAHKKFINQPGWTQNSNMIHQANNNKIYDSYMEGAITKSELFKQYQEYNKLDGPPIGAHFTGGGKGNVWMKNPDHPSYDAGDPSGFKQSATYKANPHLYDTPAETLNKSPPQGGMSLAGKYDKLLNDLDDGIITKAEYDQEVNKLHAQIPNQSLSSSDKAIADMDEALKKIDEELAKKGLDKTQKAAKGILDPEDALFDSAKDAKLKSAKYNVDWAAALDYFKNFKKKKSD